MSDKPKEKWYFRTYGIIILFLSFGPLVLPLVWFNPRYDQKAKVMLSVIIIVLSYFMGVLLLSSIKSIGVYYKALLQGYGTLQ